MKAAYGLLATVIVGGIGVIAVGAVVHRPSYEDLLIPNPHAYASTTEVGHPFTDGLEILQPTGTNPLTIDSIRMEADSGLTLVGAEIVPPPRRVGAIQALDDYPPGHGTTFDSSTLIPAAGAVLDPSLDPHGAGWELVLGIRADRIGVLTRTEVDVDYTVDGHQRTAAFPAELAVCSVAEVTARDDCAIPALPD